MVRIDTQGVILAGGISRRMGQNKALLPLGGKPMIDRVVESLRCVTEDLLLIANEPETYAWLQLDTVHDRIAGLGALGGVYTALSHLHTSYALIVACDMPFLHPPVLRRIVSAGDGYDVVVPSYGGHYQPLCALYGRNALPAIEQLIKRGEGRVDQLYPLVRTCYLGPEAWRELDPEDRTFFNINTPEDYERACRIG